MMDGIRWPQTSEEWLVYILAAFLIFGAGGGWGFWIWGLMSRLHARREARELDAWRNQYGVFEEDDLGDLESSPNDVTHLTYSDIFRQDIDEVLANLPADSIFHPGTTFTDTLDSAGGGALGLEVALEDIDRVRRRWLVDRERRFDHDGPTYPPHMA